MTDPSGVTILSPGLDQAKAIGELLRRSNPARRLTGALMPGEMKPLLRHPFDIIEPFREKGSGEASCMIPTGALSTAMLLERGDIRLGEVTMSREALRFYDKPWSIDAALGAGVPAPKTWYSVDAIESFPVFFKSATEGGGQRGVAHAPADIPEDKSDLIFQEYIVSQGTYGVGIVAAKGRLQAMHIHHEIESAPAVGGSAVVVQRIADERLGRYVEQLVKHTGYSGWGLVEFKYCPRRGDYVFMELNAKFWASSEFAFRNEPLFVALLFGAKPLRLPCERMIFMHRAFERGPAFLATRLPRMMRGGELRFVSGAWQQSAARLLMPRSVAASLRKWRSR